MFHFVGGAVHHFRDFMIPVIVVGIAELQLKAGVGEKTWNGVMAAFVGPRAVLSRWELQNCCWLYLQSGPVDGLLRCDVSRLLTVSLLVVGSAVTVGAVGTWHWLQGLL